MPNNPPIFREFTKALGPYVGNFLSASLLAVLFARWMGVDHYGAFAFAYHILRLVALLAGLGFNLAAVRFIPLYGRNDNAGLVRGFLRVGFLATLLFGLLLGFVVLSALLPFLEGSHSYHVLKHLWWVAPLLGINVYFSGVMRSYGLASWAAASRGFMRDLIAILFAFFMTGGARIISPEEAFILFACAVSLCALTQALSFVRLIPKKLRRVKPRYDLKTWLGSSLPMLASSVAEISIATVGILIIRLAIDEKAVALYHVAWVVSTLALIPTQALVAVVGRHLSRLSSVPGKGFERLLKTSLHLQFFTTVSVGLLLIFFSRPLLLLFGPAYGEAQPILTVLVVAKVFHSVVMLLARSLALSGHEKPVARSLNVFVSLIITTSLILVFPLGPMGVAAAYLFFGLVATFYYCIKLRRWLEISLFLHQAR
jgi:O-antigen/teichoic acid export membrane protein